MTSSRPYLIRALYEWINDNGLTPYLLVDTLQPGVEVPTQHVHDGKIVLNIAPRAIQHLQMGNENIEFHARFSGTPMTVIVPVAAVLAIYAMETGQGMVFSDDDNGPPKGPEPGPSNPDRPSLKLVK